MTKGQALQSFWSGFGIPAYDGTVVIPSDASMPYITYEAQTDSFESTLVLSASLWYYSESWADIEAKTQQIAQHIVTQNPPAIPIDGGRMYITKGEPFAQRMSDENPIIRRMVLNINIEFFTEY